MYWDGHGGGGWAVAMIVMMVLFWGGLLALAWVAVRSLAPRSPRGAGARAILEERLARGEIEPEEFERRAALLGDRR